MTAEADELSCTRCSVFGVRVCVWETWPDEAVKRQRKRHSSVVLPREKSILWQWLEIAGIVWSGCKDLAGKGVQR